ncbi:MAG: type II toxin-antitoxin system HicB family antitoxin, partial [Pseudonocardiaceae bacterium]
ISGTQRRRYRRRAALHYVAMSVQHFSVVVEWDSDDDLWVTHVPALDGLSTYGDTREAAVESTREAIEGYLEAAGKAGIPLPRSGPEPSIVEVEVSLP